MKILFVTYTRIGDAVLSSGLLAHLITRYPEAEITLVCGHIPAPLFAGTPGLARLIPLAKRRLKGHWLKLWLETVGTGWDLVVDLRNSIVSRSLRARRRHILSPAREPLHRVRHLARLLDLDEPPSPRLWLTRAAQARARELMRAEGPVLALGPTANWRGKQWPAENFAELARRLTASSGILAGPQVAVLGAPPEREAAGPVIEAIDEGRLIDLAGTIDLGVAAACLGQASLYVGNDSGLMHMAAAMGTPTLGLFGPSDEAVYAPWGERVAWARTTESYQQIRQHPSYDLRGDGRWMDGLSIDAVEAAVMALWRRTGGRSA